MLSVDKLQASYGAAQILFDVGFAVGAGEIVTLLGRNGMGKTTTINTVMGLVPAQGGTITFNSTRLNGRAPHDIAITGVGLVPEGRQIFSNLTVHENLVATARPGVGDKAWTLDKVYALFPGLAERRRSMGGQLSGGEQQMLALGRALMTNPQLVILDEATEGLAPLVRRKIWACIERLRRDGIAILLVDKHIDVMLELADRHVILEKGRVVWTGTSAALKDNAEVRERYLQV